MRRVHSRSQAWSDILRVEGTAVRVEEKRSRESDATRRDYGCLSVGDMLQQQHGVGTEYCVQGGR